MACVFAIQFLFDESVKVLLSIKNVQKRRRKLSREKVMEKISGGEN
jgi:hypothetical protein